jgi:Mg-chelatase subunit ChlD
MFASLVRSSSILVLLGVTATPALSQTIISGIVRAERSGPLVDAVVQITGTHAGVQTNAAGRYRLEIPNDGFATVDSVTVMARRIGFNPITRRVALRPGSVTLDFELKPSMVKLESVVVTGAAVATDEGAPGVAKERARAVLARPESRSMGKESRSMDKRDAAVPAAAMADRESRSRADGSRVGRRGVPNQEPRPGVLTAAVWDDSQHWPQYNRFLGRASENSWNPWGLEVGQTNVRPIRANVRPRSTRRALDVGFLVDATGSMGDEMTFLQSELKDIVRRVRAVEPDLDIRMSVVFYRDRGDAFITKSLPFTRNIDEAVSFISGTTADGGGDFPEDMNAGLEAMMRQSWSRDAAPQMLFLVADAPPQQYAGEDYTYHEAIQDAAAKGIAIYPVAASGVDKPTEFLFRAMAVMTGGKYVFLTDDSGVGNSHDEPDISGYTVEKLNDLMVREIRSYVATHTTPRGIAINR